MVTSRARHRSSRPQWMRPKERCLGSRACVPTWVGRCDNMATAMRVDAGSTTTELRVKPTSAESRELALVWLFPRPSTPAVDLLRGSRNERVIGRCETCDVRLTGNEVSREHAALRRVRGGSRLQIVDLESRNGVRVNGREVAAATLGAGDVVRLGGWVGLVTEETGPFTELAPGLLGGPVLQAAVASLARGAPSDLPIVVEGETGTGKEVVVRAVHRWSGRAGPLVAVNCATLPDGLVEAELFGHRRGAFTGADRASPGLFRSAQGGTVLLDEVSDLPLGIQAKLLRVLQEREVLPVGETRAVPIDVRVVVAGQQSLAEAVQAGRFRGDLLARLDGLTVRLPPLRHRKEDVVPLFLHFLREKSGGRAPAIEADLVERLCIHDWPFNVREMVQLVRRMLVLHADESTLCAHHLPERMSSANDTEAVPRPDSAVPDGYRSVARIGAQCVSSAPPPAGADSVELSALMVALRAAGGNVSRAAAMLGISRQRAYRLMDSHAVDLEALRSEGEGGGGGD